MVVTLVSVTCEEWMRLRDDLLTFYDARIVCPNSTAALDWDILKFACWEFFFLLTASTPSTPPQHDATNKEEIDKKSKLTPCLEDFGLSSYTLNMLNRPSQAQQAEFKVPGAAVPERFGFGHYCSDCLWDFLDVHWN